MNNSQETKQINLIKNGDVIKLGEHVLVCGSSTDKTLVQKVLEDTEVHLVLTDPPYSVDYVASKEGFSDVKKKKHISNDEFMSDEKYTQFTMDWLSPVLSNLTKKNSIYIFNSDKMIFALREAMVNLKLKVSQLLIWVKNKPVIGRLDYLPQHELILYGWSGTHDFKKSKSKSVLFYPKPNRSKLHPTMKPIPLLRHLILNSTKVGDVVYDPFGGSGSTLIACEHTKRKCIIFELDSEYCQTICDRYKKLKS
jgi:DNA modification methylase